MRSVDWSPVYNCNVANPSIAFDRFIDIFKNICDKHVPIKTKRISTRHISKPWLSRGILKSVKNKHKLYSKMRKFPEKENLKEKYRQYRNMLTSIIRKAKKMHYYTQFQENMGDTNKTWKIINEIINKKGKVSKTPQKLQSADGEKYLTVDNDIANEFNSFFTNIGPNLAAQINDAPLFESFLPERNEKSFSFNPVTELEVMSEIKRLNTKKSCGIDAIHPKLVVDSAMHISQPLTHIINNSFQYGIFPEALKVAKVTPLYKKGSTDELGNYRPISVLSVFSKIIEKIVHKRLMSFIGKFNILNDCQFGFQKKRNTKLALLELVTDITARIDTGYFGIGIFIDLKKAFDTINHNILFRKMELYGFRGVSLDWLTSYLSKRKQTVKINNSLSGKLEIQCGVPQGSILGPILFLLYINDICNSTNAFSFKLFADDTCLFRFSNSQHVDISETQFQGEFSKVINWCQANKLTINDDKTNFSIFKSSRKVTQIENNLQIGSAPLNRVDYVTYLGVILDSGLSWKQHINKIKNTITPIIGIISKIRHYVPKSILVTIYNSLILPHLSYCIEVWGHTFETVLKPLYILQKRIVRLMNFANFSEHSEPLFKKFGILNIYKLCKLQTGMLIFDLKNKNLASNELRYFEPISHSHNTRSLIKSNFYVQRVNSTRSQKSVIYSGTIFWNSLPLDLKIITSRNKFKRNLKIHLLHC